MFLENTTNQKKQTGWMEVICGSMFSGKTEELIRRMNRADIAGQKIILFKPSVDTRYDDNFIVSHNKHSIKSLPISDSYTMIEKAKDYDVIGIDEAQFFDENIVEVCNSLANDGKRIIIAGLDMDFKGRPFGQMPFLMATAEYVTKVHAICVKTGNLAHYSHRTTKEDSLIQLGETDHYEALSRSAYLDSLKSDNN